MGFLYSPEWQRWYYQNPKPEYAVAGLQTFFKDDLVDSTHSFSVGQVVFFAELIRGMTPTEVEALLSFTINANIHGTLQQSPEGHKADVVTQIMINAAHHVGKPEIDEVITKVGRELGRGSHILVRKHVEDAKKHPAVHISKWALPCDDIKPLKGAWDAPYSSLYEICPWSAMIRGRVQGPTVMPQDTQNRQDKVEGMTPFHNFAAYVDTCTIDALWMQFFATGDLSFVRKLFNGASHCLKLIPEDSPWMKDMLNGPDCIPLELSQKLMDEVKNRGGDAAVRYGGAMIAAWSLCFNAIDHPSVLEELHAMRSDESDQVKTMKRIIYELAAGRRSVTQMAPRRQLPEGMPQ